MPSSLMNATKPNLHERTHFMLSLCCWPRAAHIFYYQTNLLNVFLMLPTKLRITALQTINTLHKCEKLAFSCTVPVL